MSLWSTSEHTAQKVRSTTTFVESSRIFVYRFHKNMQCKSCHRFNIREKFIIFCLRWIWTLNTDKIDIVGCISHCIIVRLYFQSVQNQTNLFALVSVSAICFSERDGYIQISMMNLMRVRFYIPFWKSHVDSCVDFQHLQITFKPNQWRTVGNKTDFALQKKKPNKYAEREGASKWKWRFLSIVQR